MTTTNSKFVGQYHCNENATSLLLDIYLLPHSPRGTILPTLFTEQEILIDLADLAVQLNTYIQQHSINVDKRDSCSAVAVGIPKRPYYRWISGGDGPVFGVHCSPSHSLDPSNQEHWNDKQLGIFMIPHLRTICRYGVCVNDEWCLIGLVLDFLESNAFSSESQVNQQYEIAVECWDIDDGQIILIEGAQYIPQWIDDIGPSKCSHRCWIRTSNVHSLYLVASPRRKWAVKLLRPKDTSQAEPLQLGEAIQLLANQPFANDSSTLEDAPVLMEEALLDRMRTSRTEQLQCHRAAVVLPESVVHLCHRRPDLITTACQMFVEHIQDPIRVKKLDDYLFGVCENWKWTTITFNRTAYAMIRTAVSPPEWIYEDSIVPSILATSSLEVKRYRRQCAIESTPHLQYGLQLGIRILAGLHHCLNSHVVSNSKIVTEACLDGKMSNTEKRILLHWSHVAKLCAGIDGSNPDARDWITDAWYVGPNNTRYDLNSILQCPVFIPEIQSSITPLTCPDWDLKEQIRKELLRPHNNEELSSNPPHHTQVDNEDWMWTLSTSKDTLSTNVTQTPSIPKKLISTESDAPTEKIEVSSLDEMLSGVQSFMDGTSTINGVETQKEHDYDRGTPIVINPTVFMNILHTALKSESAQELSDRLNATTETRTHFNDPFFSDEDYLLMDPSSDHDSDDDDNGNDAGTMNMEDIMNVMDAELREGASTSRVWDSVDDINSDDDIARNAHVLSNLLKSIDAGGGGPGPMRNILMEMGGSVRLPLDAGTENEHDSDD